jgi:sarcosine oxidase
MAHDKPRGGRDVAIVGGGVIGASIAYFLASDMDFDGCAVLIERAPAYRHASTPRSVGGLRQQFSTPENIRMSLFGLEFLRSAGERLAVNGQRPEIDFVENGYLTLASEAGEAVLRENCSLQRSLGADIRVLDCDGLRQRFPWLNTGGLAAGAFGESGEGWIDPYSLLRAFRAKARTLGVEILNDAVTGLACSGSVVTGVRLASGRELPVGWVVDAAGIRAAGVAAMAGIDDLPVRPRKRFVFTFRSARPIPAVPLVADPGGFYFRAEGDGFIAGCGPRVDTDCEDFDIQYELFDEFLWPALARRVPIFEAIRTGLAWAGHYAYNVADQNAVLGAHPEVANFFFANGFSGHGLQQAPAVGRAIAELIVHGEYRSLDLSRFGFERFARGELVHERNII